MKNFSNIISFGISSFFVGILYSQGCPPLDTLTVNSNQNYWNFPTENQWDEVEIMTWNLREFPTSNSTVNHVQEIISDILPDIIAFQEINDGNAFNELAQDLPAYDFVSSGSGLALAARRDIVEISHQTTLFPSSGYEFAWRYPFKVDLTWSCGLSSSVLSVIVVHLKAGGSSDDFDRRYESCELLNDYVASNNDENIIILGDYNDEITDNQSNNSLWPLVNSEHIQFATESIANSDYWASYPSWPSFIDHIALSSQLFDEYYNGSIKTIRVDDYTGYSNFQNNISDHRPVLWSFPLEVIDMPTGLVISEIMQNPNAVSDTYGEWFEITNIGDEVINLNGLLIHDAGDESHTINDNSGIYLQPNDFIVFGINNDISTNGGIHIDYLYSDIFLSNSWDEIIISHPSGIVLDEVHYDNGMTFPDEAGYSMFLEDLQSDNNVGSSWAISTQEMASGDYGTPGTFNSEECTGTADVNSDGVLNILDIVNIIQFILDESDFTPIQICISDVNNDDVVNILDIVIIVNLILGT